MTNWFMVTIVGEDRAGIVSAITSALSEHGCNLGETSMVRLGGNFTIMMMVSSGEGVSGLENILRPVAHKLGLHLHIDAIHAHLHDHREADVQIRVFGADRVGIVAEVTDALARSGLNILDLNSEVAGSASEPVYVMVIDGRAEQGVDKIEQSLSDLQATGIEATVTPLDTMIG